MKSVDIAAVVERDGLWRAKEIFQGRMRSSIFNTELLSQYGEILLLMNDKIEAGRYLYCSGNRKPEYSEAIALFIDKNRRDDPEQFLSCLPRMVRRQSHLAEFISSTEFELNGWSAEALSAIRPFVPKNQRDTTNLQSGPTSWLHRMRGYAKTVFGFAPFFLLLTTFVVGAVTILNGAIAILKSIWSAFAR